MRPPAKINNIYPAAIQKQAAAPGAAAFAFILLILILHKTMQSFYGAAYGGPSREESQSDSFSAKAAAGGPQAQPLRMLSILFLVRRRRGGVSRRHKKIFKSFYQETVLWGRPSGPGSAGNPAVLNTAKIF